MSQLIPQEFRCSRCGYCCKQYGPELPFTEKDIELWAENAVEWIFYHPFIDWFLYEFLCPMNGVYRVDNREEAKQLLRNAESKFEEEIGYRPEPFPWGGTMWYCTFLKWMGNKWGCLIHDLKSKRCRSYLCYWDRLEPAFTWIFGPM